MKRLTTKELNERLTKRGAAKTIIYEHIHRLIKLEPEQLDKCLKVKNEDENRI